MFGDNSTQNTSDTTVPSSTKPINDGLMGLSSSSVMPDVTSADTSSTSTPTSQAPDTDNSNSDNNSVITSAGAPADNDLQSIKKEALMELSPLVKELDQTPEDKFETLMMMIQATDNKSLVSDAFETAKKISEDKKRARALLDIINEINYFNQPKND